MTGIVDHGMLRVEDLDSATDSVWRHLGYGEKGCWEADTFTNVFMGPADVHEDGALLELTYNHDGRSYTMGDAWGHLAVRADDLHEFWEALMDREAEDYRDPASCDDRYGFMKDADGHEIEVVEQ